MEVCNSLLSLKDGLVPLTVYPILPIILLHIKTEGGFGLGQIATALVPLTLEDGVDPWIPPLIII